MEMDAGGWPGPFFRLPGLKNLEITEKSKIDNLFLAIFLVDLAQNGQNTRTNGWSPADKVWSEFHSTSVRIPLEDPGLRTLWLCSD